MPKRKIRSCRIARFTPNPRSKTSKLVINRRTKTGFRYSCDAARLVSGKERERYLKQAIANHSGAWCESGVQVGALVRALLAVQYAGSGKFDEAERYGKELLTLFPGAIDDSGAPLDDVLEGIRLLRERDPATPSRPLQPTSGTDVCQWSTRSGPESVECSAHAATLCPSVQALLRGRRVSDRCALRFESAFADRLPHRRGRRRRRPGGQAWTACDASRTVV